MAMLGNFARSMKLWNSPWWTWIRSERLRYHSLRVSAIGLKFSRMMHSSMKQITIKWLCSGNFLRVHETLKLSMMGFDREDDSYQDIWGNHIMAWNSVAWCNVPWSGLSFVMATLSQCFHFFPRPAEGAVILRISCYFLGLTANEDMNWKSHAQNKKKYHVHQA